MYIYKVIINLNILQFFFFFPFFFFYQVFQNNISLCLRFKSNVSIRLRWRCCLYYTAKIMKRIGNVFRTYLTLWKHDKHIWVNVRMYKFANKRIDWNISFSLQKRSWPGFGSTGRSLAHSSRSIKRSSWLSGCTSHRISQLSNVSETTAVTAKRWSRWKRSPR